MTLSLCKYVGSKAAILASSPHLFPTPAHGGKALVAFVGGGSVAAHYGSRGFRVIASDINARLVSAHVQVRDHVETVIGHMERIVAGWRRVLEEAAEDGDADKQGRLFFEDVRADLDIGGDGQRAARLLFIIRAGFNGLYRENDSGDCTTAYGKPASSRDLVQAENLRAYSAAIQGVEFHCEDFAVTCAQARAGDAVSLDPPYQGTFTDYAGGDWDAANAVLPGMGRVSDRERLVAMLAYLDAIGCRFAVHDSLSATTRRLYDRWALSEVTRSGRVNSNGGAREDVIEGCWRNWQ